MYKMVLKSKPGKEVSKNIAGSTSDMATEFAVTVGGTTISNFTHDGIMSILTWTDSDNPTNASLTLYVKVSDDRKERVFHFSGPLISSVATLDDTYINPYVGQYKTTLEAAGTKCYRYGVLHFCGQLWRGPSSI